MQDNYARIFRKYRRNIRERIELIHQEYNDYVESINIAPESVCLPVDILFDVVRNYYVDLDRMKTFHNIEKANRIKIAAYQTYWIVRLKPIQVLKVDKKNPQRHILINEYFAIHTLISQLYSHGNFTSNKLESWNSFIEQLAYHLRFRPLDAQSLELTIIALQTSPVFPSRG